MKLRRLMLFLLLGLVALAVHSAAFIVSSSVVIRNVCCHSDRSSIMTPRRRGVVRWCSSSQDSSARTNEDEQATTTVMTTTDTNTVTIALTREEGNNEKLRQLLKSRLAKRNNNNVQLVELPCIQHSPGPDIHALSSTVSSDKIQDFDYVLITSPEAAKVFTDSLKQRSIPQTTKIAAVGKATERALVDQGIHVDFVPTKATGETLAMELPPIEGKRMTRVLYPASAKAADTIQTRLESRPTTTGCVFQVTRLNTYDTVPASFTPSQLSIMRTVHLVCFGSPSAVFSWIQNNDRLVHPDATTTTVGTQQPYKNEVVVVAACIGQTSAKACLESKQWEAQHIYYPKENPGLEGWADSIVQALDYITETKCNRTKKEVESTNTRETR